MTLTAKGRATRERIVEATGAYLRSDAPGEITLDDIRAVTGTSKGQLFHYFPGGKEELLLAAIRREADRVIDDQQPQLDDLTSRSGWERWSTAVVSRYRALGANCPLAALMDQASTPGAAEVISTLLLDWRERLARGIRAMQGAGEARADADAARVAASVIAGIQGGVQVLRSTGETDTLEASLALHLEYLTR
ncbi:TetR/AcrR family transcriptional regulator [Microbacterium sp. LBN7]|uniref:TetR/AcrR family transcriptional regulator n=2 Tax=Bacteria TaxID=2 RepID=UPI00324842A9